jgi:peptidoglycan/LPS O-acetylase OafA/YrhL
MPMATSESPDPSGAGRDGDPASSTLSGTDPRGADRSESGTPASPRRRLHEIDGLRALAVCLIVFHHSFTNAIVAAPRPRSFGSLFSSLTMSGVDLFFVLSGVLLLRPYLRREREFSAPTYLRRRVERLWPPYLAALVMAGCVIWLTTAHRTWYSGQVLPRFSLADWVRQAGLVNFGWTTYNGAWWSLTIEVLFYLAVPVILGVVLLCRTRTRRIGAAVLVGAGILAAVVAATPGSPAIGELAAVFAPCFVMGAILARYRFSTPVGVAAVVGGGAYAVIVNWLPHADVHLGFAMFYGGVVILAMSFEPLTRRLSAPLAVWLGERSYSIFLVHFSAFYLANWMASLVIPSRTARYFLLSRSLGIPLALTAAVIVFWLIERRYARGLATADAFWPPLRGIRIGRATPGERDGLGTPGSTGASGS